MFSLIVLRRPYAASHRIDVILIEIQHWNVQHPIAKHERLWVRIRLAFAITPSRQYMPALGRSAMLMIRSALPVSSIPVDRRRRVYCYQFRIGYNRNPNIRRHRRLRDRQRPIHRWQNSTEYFLFLHRDHTWFPTQNQRREHRLQRSLRHDQQCLG